MSVDPTRLQFLVRARRQRGRTLLSRRPAERPWEWTPRLVGFGRLGPEDVPLVPDGPRTGVSYRVLMSLGVLFDLFL